MKRLALLACGVFACSAQTVTSPPWSISLGALSITTQGATAGGLLASVDVAATTGGDASAAGKPVAGVALAFATNQMGISFVPASVTTGPDGHGAALVLIPWGQELLASVTSANGGFLTVPLGAGQVHLESTQTPADAPDAGGSIITVRVVATVPVSASVVVGLDGGAPGGTDGGATAGPDAGVDGQPAPGVAISFGTNTMGVSFFPGMVLTDVSGAATSEVFVSFSAMSEVLGTISGGGQSLVIPLSPLVR